MSAAAAVILALFAAHFAGAAPPPLWGDLRPGPHGVGLRVVTLRDGGRVEGTGRGRAAGRPLRITVWYPAAPAARPPRARLADYLRISGGPAAEAAAGAGGEAALRRGLAAYINASPPGVDDATLGRILDSQVAAVANARPRRGRYPLVLWSARHGTVVAQSVLSEYLASHGYVVAFATYAGPAMPLPYQTEDAAEKRATLEAHVRDLEFALDRARGMPNVSRGKAAVVSWSYAGESATLLQVRRREVGLVISLSSNVLEGWVYQGPEALARFDPSRLNVPYVIMTERVSTNGTVREPPAALGRAAARSYFVRFGELAHGNFNAAEGFIPALFGVGNVARWSKAGPAAKPGYETIARLTLRFLDAHLKARGRAGGAGRDWTGGLPESFVSVTAYGGARGDIR